MDFITILGNFALLFVFEQILVFAHEGGHALTAAAFRLRLVSITVGGGKRVASFAIAGVPVFINIHPLGGITQAMANTRSWFRLRHWMFAAGGPAVNLSLIVISVIVFPELLDVRFFIKNLLTTLAPVEVFVFANLLSLVVTLVPRKLVHLNREVETDGLQLLKIPFMKDQDIESAVSTQMWFEARAEALKGNIDAARKLYELELENDPDNAFLKYNLAGLMVQRGQFEMALRQFLLLVEAEEFQIPENRPALLNSIAWNGAVTWNDDYLELADRYSFEAYTYNPDNLYFSGTRGTVLVRLGKFEEGITLLRNAYQCHSEPHARAAEACFVAIGYAGLSNFAQASRWIRQARSDAPDYFLIDRAMDEVERFANAEPAAAIAKDIV